MIRNLEIALEKTRIQLETCQSKLELSSKSVIGQAISGLGSLGTCLANPPERPFVSEMLRILELETHSGVVPSRSLEFSTSAQELQTLRRFILHDDIKFAEVQNILLKSLSRVEDGLVGRGLHVLSSLGVNRIKPSIALLAIVS